MGRTVLVTGCTGFVGSHLSRELTRRGAHVIGLSRNGSESALRDDGVSYMVRGALADRLLLERAVVDRSVDTIFHLAAQSKPRVAAEAPRETFETNVQGTSNLLDAVRAAGRPVRVVLASSDAVYGDSGEWPYTEESELKGTSPYATSKICAEALARCYHGYFGVPIGVARTSNVYGDGDLNLRRIIPGTIRAAVRGDGPVIESDGRPEREYLYVSDAVDAYLRLASALDRSDVVGSTFNFTREGPVSVLDVVDSILRLTGRENLKPHILGTPGGVVSRIHSSASKAEDVLGWRATVSLEAGLAETISRYVDRSVDIDGESIT